MGKKVFISHSSRDYAGFVQGLVAELEAKGAEVWVSEDGVPDGVDYAEKIFASISSSDFVLVVLSDAVYQRPGQVFNEINLASQLGKKKIAITLTPTPLPRNFAYHIQLNTIRWHERPNRQSYEILFRTLGIATEANETEERFDSAHTASDAIRDHTNHVFSHVYEMGGFSWGMDKSVVQNLNGGWKPTDICIEDVDEAPFDPEEEPFADSYRDFTKSRAYNVMLRKGKNHTRWMLTGFDIAYSSLFLSLRRTEWGHCQFVWHQLLADEKTRTAAIEDFFEEEMNGYPNSLCLHLVLVDSNDALVATRIVRRKRDDYPGSIAVTLGEQLSETDFTSSDNFVGQWLRRAVVEEFGFSEADLPAYVDEPSARVLALVMEGDIYNFALVCCVRLKCSIDELRDYYAIHRSSNDEFDELIPIPPDSVGQILTSGSLDGERYHPSSYLRMLYGYWYIRGELPTL